MNEMVDITPTYDEISDTQVVDNFDDKRGYYEIGDTITDESDSAEGIERSIPSDLDIFSELPKSVYENSEVRDFLSSLRKNLIKNMSIFDGVTLNKLRVSESTNSMVVLEWIYNYFRYYYGFYKDDGDFYGYVINNPVAGDFTNYSKKMSRSEFDNISEKSLIEVVQMVKG